MRNARWEGGRTAATVFFALVALVGLTHSGRLAASPQRLGGSDAQSPRINVPGLTTAQPTDVGPVQLTPDRIAAFADAQARHLNYLPGEVLVKFKPGMSPDRQQRALSALRSRPSVNDLHWLAGGTALLRDLTQPDANILAEQLREQTEVDSAEPNYLRHLPTQHQRSTGPTVAATFQPQLVPNDPQYGNLQWNFSLINMPGAWDINPGGSSSLIVATVDTGVTTQKGTFTFPLFTGSKIENVNLPFDVSTDLPTSRLVSPHDFVFMPSGGPVLDFDGHGTHVSSTIGEATNNGIELAGMAYNVRIMPVKVCLDYWQLMIANAQAGHTGFLPADAGGCPDDAIISGIFYATDNGAKVINISLGGPDPSPLMQSAIQYAVSHGAFVSIAMGNSYQEGNPINYPAFYAAQINGAMSVAAVSQFQHHSYYSSSGSYCEISAPGGDDTDGNGFQGQYVWQVTLFFPDQDPTQVLVPRFDRYQHIGYEGTSMATPHVAGMAALLYSQGITDPAALEAIIKQTAKDLGTPGRDDLFGYGLIQPRTALFGFGIIK
jgi:serine protease